MSYIDEESEITPEECNDELAALVENGQAEVTGVDTDGNFCYKLTAKGLLVQQVLRSLEFLLEGNDEAQEDIMEILADNLS